uniref:Flavin-containing monooxygenase n=1 Tax=Hirondellea gigas TaxID=1518452 RepID=A0A6A7G035_9CRUS
MQKVAIIGAGAAGLCALRHVLNTPGLTPIIWEKSNVVGGTWVYSDQIDKDDYGLPVHSSMYKSLKTNLPKEVMAFPDFPFKAGNDSFIHHTEVRSYLDEYAEHYHLMEHIKFEHQVERVNPVTPGSSTTEWEISVKDLKTDVCTTIICQDIIVANGHYSVPKTPSLRNIEQFSGTMQHSHQYREPDQYKGKRVAVLGAAASGLDIALELTTFAEKVFLCHNLPVTIPSELPSNLLQVSGITALKDGTKDVFVLKDGSEIQANALLYCTGYEFTFPFLSEECGVHVVEQQVRPLYRHLIHCNYPSMAFIGIPFQICPFPFFDVQVRFLLASVTAAIKLPSTELMLEHMRQSRQEAQDSGIAPRHLHRMGSLQWAYLDQLADDALTERLKPAVRMLYNHVHRVRKLTVTTYKNKRYQILFEIDSFKELS